MADKKDRTWLDEKFEGLPNDEVRRKLFKDLLENGHFMNTFEGGVPDDYFQKYLADEMSSDAKAGRFESAATQCVLAGRRDLGVEYARKIKSEKFMVEYLRAAGLLEEVENYHQDKLQQCLESNHPEAAAMYAEELGDLEKAIELLQGVDNPRSELPRVLGKAGHHAEAAAIYVERGRWRDAAKSFSKAGDDEQAKLYSSIAEVTSISYSIGWGQ